MNDQQQLEEIPKNWIPISEAARYLRVSKDTLRRWERSKILHAYRSPTNRRYYKMSELEDVFSKKPEIQEKISEENQAVTAKPNSSNLFLLLNLVLLFALLVLFAFYVWITLRS